MSNVSMDAAASAARSATAHMHSEIAFLRGKETAELQMLSNSAPPSQTSEYTAWYTQVFLPKSLAIEAKYLAKIDEVKAQHTAGHSGSAGATAGNPTQTLL